MGCMDGMKRMNSENYVGTCRYEGQPNVCDFVNIENGNIVVWKNKGEDKVFSKSDFSDIKVIAYIVLAQGLQVVIGANVNGTKMAFQLEYTRLGTNESLAESVLSDQKILDSLIGRANRAQRIQNFLNTIGSSIRVRAIDWSNTKKIVMHSSVALPDSYEIIMSSFKD